LIEAKTDSADEAPRSLGCTRSAAAQLFPEVPWWTRARNLAKVATNCKRYIADLDNAREKLEK
jgi:hypothetical protein